MQPCISLLLISSHVLIGEGSMQKHLLSSYSTSYLLNMSRKALLKPSVRHTKARENEINGVKWEGETKTERKRLGQGVTGFWEMRSAEPSVFAFFSLFWGVTIPGFLRSLKFHNPSFPKAPGPEGDGGLAFPQNYQFLSQSDFLSFKRKVCAIICSNRWFRSEKLSVAESGELKVMRWSTSCYRSHISQLCLSEWPWPLPSRGLITVSLWWCL